jgi:hypothetical protein
MANIRRRLRLCATTWLVFQVAWLTALVPRDCCAAHRPAEQGCHESTSATECPMRAADGRPCPMHRGGAERGAPQSASAEHHHQPIAAEHDHRTPGRPIDCRLTGVCDGPMAALFALLWNHGILRDATAAMPNAAVRAVVPAAGEHAIGRFEPPDPPPPRA